MRNSRFPQNKYSYMPMDDKISKRERVWGMLCHLLAIPAAIVPFGNIIAPLLIWISKKRKSSFVDHHGRESINFQITFTLIWILAPVIVFFWAVNEILFFSGCIVLGFLVLFYLLQIINSCFLANKGEKNKYPFALRLIK